MLDGPGWSADLFARLSALGHAGSSLHDFTDADGIGSATYLTGKGFTTADVGTVPGVGAGIGTGITGLTQSTLAMTMYNNSVAQFGQAGSELFDTCNQIAASCIAQIALATLATVNSPVFAGVGTVVVGSIAVVPADWGSAIQTQGASLQGSEWGNYAQVLGAAKANAVLSSGTGTVTITGSPISTPGPGTGVGTGTLS